MTMQFAVAIEGQITSDLVTRLNAAITSSGLIRFFDGTQPALCEDGDSGTLLTTNTLASAPLVWSSGNTFDAGTINPSTVVADGNVKYWRITDSSLVCICQGSAGVNVGDNIIFNEDDWLIGDTVNVTSMTFTLFLEGTS